MHSTSATSYRLPLLLALALHLFVCVFLFGQFVSHTARPLQLQPDVAIIQAVAITPAEVTAKITRQKVEEVQETPPSPPQQQEIQPPQETVQTEVQEKRVEQMQKKEAAAAAQKALLEKQAQKIALEEKVKKAAEAKKEKEAKKAAEKAAQEEAKHAELKKQALKKEAEKKKQEKAIQALKLAQQKELESQMAAEKKQLEAARTSENQSEIEKYTALILHTMRQNWIMPEGINPEISCQLTIRLKSDGSVVSVQVIRSSGNTALDNSARLAVFKSSPLPVPADKDLFDKTFREFNLTVSKKE